VLPAALKKATIPKRLLGIDREAAIGQKLDESFGTLLRGNDVVAVDPDPASVDMI
jgi:hypothetical protein